MKIIDIPARSVSYGDLRSLDSVSAIVIHYTGNDGDTAENNGKYFQNSNTRNAGAHFFVDRSGVVVQSVPISRIAWSVGGSKYNNGGGKYYGRYTNANTISIELCDNANKDPSNKQIKAVKKLIKYIKGQCKNAKKIIRHYDVNGKPCPARMIDEKKWSDFLAKVKKCGSSKPIDTSDHSCPYKVKITADELNVRAGAGTSYKVTTKIHRGEVYTITAEKMNGSTAWGKLKSGAGWISLKYTKKA